MANVKLGNNEFEGVNAVKLNTPEGGTVIFEEPSPPTQKEIISAMRSWRKTSMNYMFAGCNNLTALDLSSLDTSGVTDMSNMFSMCSSMTALDLSNFDTSNVTSMAGMFVSCAYLAELDLSSFDTSKVTGMSTMFYSCTRLTKLNLSSFDTSAVKNITNMFSLCSNLRELILGDRFVFSASVSFKESPLSATSVNSVITHLKDLTGATAQTLTLKANVGAGLTEAQKAEITAKNWTLVY